MFIGRPDGRFAFGRNWQRFLRIVDEDRVCESRDALADLLGVISLEGLTFLDVGSGSGLSSLAARRLGARVHSFDYDADSVSATTALRQRFAPNDPLWSIEQGSALDREYLGSLDTYDVVYSWGVLHHTGALWDALGNMPPLVAEGGRLAVAIYNDLGGSSRRWRSIKRRYSTASPPTQAAMIAAAGGAFGLRYCANRVVRAVLRDNEGGDRPNDSPRRGMSRWYDLIDWVGGYPFEVAKPEAVFRFYRERGFELLELRTCGKGHGCNEFTFRRTPSALT